MIERLLKLVEPLPDEALRRLRLGGHDPRKVYAAYKAAMEHQGGPTVILARTIKGYGLGEAGEGKNVTHQQKKLNEEELKEFRSRFGIPLNDEDCATLPFYRPSEDSHRDSIFAERRETLGGYTPTRSVRSKPIEAAHDELFKEFSEGSDGREVSTTMAFVGMLRKMLKDPEIGKLIVPIVPDEARTFGMESLFRTVGIYASGGQKYEPVDMNTLLLYKEQKDGQILEEGITEAGSMASFIAAGSCVRDPWHQHHSVFYLLLDVRLPAYRRFHLGRCGYACREVSCWAELSGRTTLAGEGLQHQDGNSHILALPVPNLKAYDPAFAYEIAVIIQDGIRRMYKEGENIFYYITVMNEQYAMPPMPEGVREGILKGLYKYRSASNKKAKLKAQLFGSGAILERSVARPGNSGAKLRRCRGCLERNQLQGAVYGRDRSGTLEPPASGRKAEGALRFAVPGRHARRAGSGFGLSENAAEYDQQMDAAAVGCSGNRRIWPQRRAHFVARLLRSGRQVHRAGDAARTERRRKNRRESRGKSDSGSGNRAEQTESGYFLTGDSGDCMNIRFLPLCMAARRSCASRKLGEIRSTY